jgi:hypothetical protein
MTECDRHPSRRPETTKSSGSDVLVLVDAHALVRFHAANKENLSSANCCGFC